MLVFRVSLETLLVGKKHVLSVRRPGNGYVEEAPENIFPGVQSDQGGLSGHIP